MDARQLDLGILVSDISPYLFDYHYAETELVPLKNEILCLTADVASSVQIFGRNRWAHQR